MKLASIISCRLWLALLMIAIPVLASSRQAKETQPSSHFAKLDARRVHYQNYGAGKEALVFHSRLDVQSELLEIECADLGQADARDHG